MLYHLHMFDSNCGPNVLRNTLLFAPTTRWNKWRMSRFLVTARCSSTCTRRVRLNTSCKSQASPGAIRSRMALNLDQAMFSKLLAVTSPSLASRISGTSMKQCCWWRIFMSLKNGWNFVVLISILSCVIWIFDTANEMTIFAIVVSLASGGTTAPPVRTSEYALNMFIMSQCKFLSPCIYIYSARDRTH